MNDHFGRLPIAHRLLLSSVAFGVPIAALVSFGFFEVQARLDDTRREKLGVRLSGPLCELSERLSRLTRIAGRASGEDRGGPAAREKAAADVEAAFNALRDPAARDAANRLGLVDESQADLVEDLRAEWRKVSAAWAEGNTGRVERTNLVLGEGIAVQLRRVRDSSHLVLDPALDSYYLMDATLRALPAVEARIATALQSRAASGADDPALVFYAGELGRIEHPLVLDALATALREDAHYFGPSPSLEANVPPLRDRYDAAVRAFVEAARRTASRDAEAGTVEESGEAALSAAADLRRAGAAELDRLLDVRVAYHSRQRLLVLALTILALAISVRHVAFILYGISRPLRCVADAAHLVATGDVAGARRRAADVPAPKEANRNEISQLGGAVREMADGLTTLLLEVRAAGGQVKETAARIAATARELEATSSEQAASTTEVSATSREIHRRAEGLAGTIGEVGKVVREASDLAADGRRGLDRMESSMGQLTAATASVSERLAAISGKAEGIGAIVTTIGRVAEQTNLLSFNAAIEAEKAGEAGKGFVVVAREIRRLADRTASAAVDIGEVVGSMRSVVSSGVMEMDRFVDQVRREGDEVRRIGGQLGTVIEQVEALTPRFAEVLGAAEAQAGSAREIREAVSQLSAAAGQTRDTLEEWSRVAQGLDGAAQTLGAQVARFRLAEDGSGATAAGG
ncbi:MAG: methyl-accepting chemotaxis protein [Holophagales bacterium]|nr:methyl-accepting chemotaxis protein [Holophagales bacterium]